MLINVRMDLDFNSKNDLKSSNIRAIFSCCTADRQMINRR